LQVALSGTVLAALVFLAADGGLGWKAAVVVGLGLALSSTAVGLQLLAERKELTAEHGRLAFAILLFQDLAAIPFLAAIPLLGVQAAGSDGDIAMAVVKAIAAIAALVLGGRYLLRHVFRVIARTRMPEVFTATALLVVLGSAWLMQLAGLSAGLGAFLAGVLLAESEFRHELESQIQPFEGLLLGLFFMAVGMSIDLQRIAAEPGTIVIGVLVLLAVKFVVLALLGRGPGRLDLRGTLLLGGTLALGGEFAFVVFGEAAKVGLLNAPQRDQLVAIVGLSMAVTPLLLLLISKLTPSKERSQSRDFDEVPDEHPHVLIAGFGRFGQIVARLLAAHNIPFIAIDPDVEQVDFVRRFGNKIYYGDPTRPDLLRAAGAANVRVFVVAIDGADASLEMTRLLRQQYPDAKVFARARDRRHAWKLMDMGAKVSRELFGSSVEMGRDVLVELGVAPEQADARVHHFRVHDAKLLDAQRQMQDDEDALLQSARDARRELAELFEADAGEGQLGRIVEAPRD